MPAIVLLGLLIGLPLILLTVLRVKPLYIFTSVVTGYLWVQFLGDPAELMLQSMTHVQYPGVVARLALLLIPIVLTLLLMKHSLSPSALPFQFFLLVANSLLIATFIIDNLPGGTQASLYATNPGNVLRQANDVLIAGIAGLHVLVMWIMRPRGHDQHGHGHHKKKH
jgi:hypothetical protein